MARLISAGTTGAATSLDFVIDNSRRHPVSMSANGIAGAETVTLQFYNGVAWVDYFKDGNTTAEQITTTNSMLSVWGVGQWRGVKSTTVAAVPIYLHTQADP